MKSNILNMSLVSFLLIQSVFSINQKGCLKDELSAYGIKIGPTFKDPNFLCDYSKGTKINCCNLKNQEAIAHQADRNEIASKKFYLINNLVNRYIVGFSLEYMALAEEVISKKPSAETAAKENPVVDAQTQEEPVQKQEEVVKTETIENPPEGDKVVTEEIKPEGEKVTEEVQPAGENVVTEEIQPAGENVVAEEVQPAGENVATEEIKKEPEGTEPVQVEPVEQDAGTKTLQTETQVDVATENVVVQTEEVHQERRLGLQKLNQHSDSENRGVETKLKKYKAFMVSPNYNMDFQAFKRRLEVEEVNETGATTDSQFEKKEEGATKFQVSQSCVSSAEAIGQLKLTKDILEKFHKENLKKLLHLQTVQTSVYCFLCDESSGDYLVDDSGVKTIKYSFLFCASMIEKVLPVVAQFHQVYNPVLKHLMTMLTCVKPGNAKIENAAPDSIDELVNLFFDIDSSKENWTNDLNPKLKVLFENPLGLPEDNYYESCLHQTTDDKKFIEPCAPFCQKFNLVGANVEYNGDLSRHILIYRILQKVESALKSNQVNLFKDKIEDLRTILDHNLADIKPENVLVKAEGDQTGLAEFKAKIEATTEGFNPLVVKFKKSKKHLRNLSQSLSSLI